MDNSFNKSTQITLSEKFKYAYTSARITFIIAVALTLVNVVLLLFGSDTYFLFSITIPYQIVVTGMLYTGKLPIEGEMTANMSEAAIIVFVAIAVVILAVYFLCFLFSKKKVGWMIAGLILFVADTLYFLVAVISSFEVLALMDLLFHGIILAYFVRGVSGYYKLKTLEKE